MGAGAGAGAGGATGAGAGACAACGAGAASGDAGFKVEQPAASTPMAAAMAKVEKGVFKVNLNTPGCGERRVGADAAFLPSFPRRRALVVGAPRGEVGRHGLNEDPLGHGLSRARRCRPAMA
jgi:hypothetical protein